MPKYDIQELLATNSYPGRGIIVGRSSDDKYAVIAYFIMGRSTNSRNRIFSETDDGIETKAFDPSLLEDPSLIIYHPVRNYEDKLIVTNGDQTDTIRDGYAEGKPMQISLKSRKFEHDGPNWTPRISAVVEKDGTYTFSILKSLDGDDSCCCRYYYEYDAPKAGEGHFIHTYIGDGSPLPSFYGEPERIDISASTCKEFSDMLWKNLNIDNKVSLYTNFVDLQTGEQTVIITNKNS